LVSETGLFSCPSLIAQVQSGTYYVALSRTASATAATGYWLTPTLLTARTNEAEPNDTTNQANLVTGSSVVACGAVAATGDLVDHFIFTLSAPAVLDAEVIEATTTSASCASGNLDSDLRLLSGAGLELDADTTSGRGSCSRLRGIPLTAGTYFLQVSEASTINQGIQYCVALRLR
jgi:hypothetical protein